MLIFPKVDVPVDLELLFEVLVVGDEIDVVFEGEIAPIFGIDVYLNIAKFSCLLLNMDEGDFFVVFGSSPPLHFPPEIDFEFVLQFLLNILDEGIIIMSTVSPIDTLSKWRCFLSFLRFS